MTDLRAVLEGIVYGDDPKITPADRLKAAEQLRDLQQTTWPTVQQLIDAMPPEEISAMWDKHRGAAMVSEALEGRSPYPRFTEALTAAVILKADALARVLADAERIDAEVERRAQEGAELLYRTRAFNTVVATDSDAAADDVPAQPDEPNVAPPGLSVADVQRPWQGRRMHISPFRP